MEKFSKEANREIVFIASGANSLLENTPFFLRPLDYCPVCLS